MSLIVQHLLATVFVPLQFVNQALDGFLDGDQVFLRVPTFAQKSERLCYTMLTTAEQKRDNRERILSNLKWNRIVKEIAPEEHVRRTV